jgi:transposase
MYKYIGIDISKSSLDLYDGKKSYKVSNTITGFREIKKLVNKKEELCLIFEPTGIYSHPLIEYCSKYSIKAIIVGSKEARDYARSIKQRSKTDKIDAKVLYRYHTQIETKDITIPSLDINMRKITQRRNVYEKYQQMIRQLKNLIEATNHKDKTLINSLQKQIKQLEKSSNNLLVEIENLLFEHENNKQAFNNLQTIPGIAKKSALVILMEFLRYPTANSKQIVALMGLDPIVKESGIFKGKSRISKQGGQYFRTKIYMATIVAIKYNDRLKVFYEKLISNGKPKKLALIASMRKLLRIAFAIFKSNKPYLVSN